MKKLSLIFLFLLSFFFCQAQYYSTGQDRASIIWREIETDKFQLVYPDYFEKEAQRIANMLVELYRLNSKSLNVKPKKVSILLHAETTKSNGYFAWAPRRGELYTTPPNSGLANDWLEHLATHEYRHVVQMDKLHQGIPKFLNILFGEQIVPAILGYKVPLWFMEGDAVLSETLLSNTGRGRSPEFLQIMKAYLLSNKSWFGYDKAVLQSYNDFVPSRYELGYAMVANTNKNYGKDFFSTALFKAGKRPYPWSNFAQYSFNAEERAKVFEKLQKQFAEDNSSNKAIELSAQWNKNKHRNATITLYNDNMTELKAKWQKEQSQIDTTKYEILSPPIAIYTDYMSPKILDDGSIVTFKSGYEDYGKFVKIKNGKEEVLFTPGGLSSSMSVKKNLLYWTENIPDLRWSEKSKSKVYYLNLSTKEKKSLDLDKDIYMVSANEDNSLLVAVAKNRDYSNELLIIDRKTGKVVFSYNFGSIRITTPQFIGKNKIAYIFTKDGTGIASLDTNTLQETMLVAVKNVPLSGLEYANGNLYFIGGYDNKNDIYSFDIAARKLKKITESPYGVAEPCIVDNTLIYSNYTAKGYEVAKMNLMEGVNENVEPTEWKDDFLLNELKSQQSSGKLKKADSLFSSNLYKEGKDLFNFHSRSPFAFSAASSGGYDLGISTTSQNLLSTMFVNVGYREKSGFSSGQGYANIVYKGWFPIISTELKYGKQSRHLLTVLKDKNLVDTATVKENKNRWEWETEVSLPFNISRGKYARYFSVFAGLEFTKDANVKQHYLAGTNEYSYYREGDELDLSLEKTHQLLKYGVSFTNMHKKSYRDIYSPFGQKLYFTYNHTPFDKKNVYTYALEGMFYLPGLAKHHGIKLYGGYQYQPKQSEFLKDNIEHPRGTVALLSERRYSIMSDYSFPLAYPDWNLGRALYVKRIRTSLFYDYGLSKTQDYSKTIHSFGTEFLADAHVMHIPLPIEFGVRLGYETQNSGFLWNALLSIAF